MTDSNRGADGPAASRRSYLKYAGLTATAGLAGCTGGGGQEAADELVIGSNHPLSGSLSYTGESMQRAMEMAAEQRNEEGGIESLGGAEVKVIAGDNEAKQELAGQVSSDLINDGADVLVGCFNSDATLSATQTAEREGVPFVISVAASDQILKERQMEYIYRLQPTTYHYARDWARFYPKLIRDAGHEIETVGHYYIDNAYGVEIHEYLRDEFLEENDLELVESTGVTLDEADANSQVTRLREADPDCICLTGYEQDAVMFFEALESLDYRPTWLSASANVGLVSEDQIQNIGEASEGVMDANYALNPNNDLTEQFVNDYEDYSDRAATPESGLAWAACQVIFDAAERAGSTDPDELNQAIAETEMDAEETPLALNGLSFQDNGENEHALAAMNQVQNREVNVVYPEKFAESDPWVEPGET